MLEDYFALLSALCGEDAESGVDGRDLVAVEVAIDAGAVRKQLPVHRTLHLPEDAKHSLLVVSLSSRGQNSGLTRGEQLVFLHTAVIIDP